jgi:hypothetical protein
MAGFERVVVFVRQLGTAMKGDNIVAFARSDAMHQRTCGERAELVSSGFPYCRKDALMHLTHLKFCQRALARSVRHRGRADSRLAVRLALASVVVA